VKANCSGGEFALGSARIKIKRLALFFTRSFGDVVVLVTFDVLFLVLLFFSYI